jgi:hypothetical protein
VIRDQQLICDGCQTVITRITTPPDPDWAMHNLCPACFLALWKQSIPPA